MPDFIGNIEVPEIVPSGTPFPVVPEFGYGHAEAFEVAVHQFGSANAKIEQRFLLGTGAKRFRVPMTLNTEQREALRDFWEDLSGPYGAFTYNVPNSDGATFTPFLVRFENAPLSWEMLGNSVAQGECVLIEIPDPDDAPVYTLNDTLTRFPSTALKSDLLKQVQEMIPLIRIVAKEPGYPEIFVSDRRCTVGSQLYQARLLELDGISQTLGNEADQARFTFGNADRVMRSLANDVDLFRASIEFSLFHVGTGIKLDLWKGEIVDWSLDSGPEFQVTAADGMYELNLPYPTRRISRQCWKDFNDGLGCPFATESSGMDLVHFPSADSSKCDKSYDAANGCLAHGMKRYFGGVLAEPQGVRVKNNSTGTWGFGRSSITSVSLVSESLYDEVAPEIYTDSAMPVNCKIAAGRDESDFYEAMGIVGEGPLGAYATLGSTDEFGNQIGHKLDGQLNHGYPGSGGLRTCLGSDPTGATDFFSLDQSGNATGGDWRKVFSGASTYKDNFAAGLAFIVIRRSDAKGLQLSQPGDHQMQAIVSQGMSGWVWTAPGERSMQVLTNPIWIVVNMLLRARGLRFADAAAAEQYFDLDAAIAAAAICDDDVDKLVGDGTETQFKFRGVLQEEKPLRDWIQEALMNCLGFYSFAFGKLKVGIRENSSVVEAFTIGNILFQSLQLSPLKPAFNHLTANFADGEFQFANNSITVYDIDHAKLIGGATSPLFLKSNVNLSGSSSKSQAGRIVSTRLREELGGITSDQWKAARQIGFRTTVLALNTEPGMVCSMTHDDMPDSVSGGIFSDNFESYADQAAFAAHWTLKGQGTLGVVPAWGDYGQGSTKGVLISQCGPLTGVFDKSVMWKTFATNYATLVMGFRVFIPSSQPLSPTAKTTLAYFSINNGSYGADIGDGYAQFGVMLTADMKLAASNLWYGVPVGTQTPLNFDTWYFVELNVTFDRTAGSFELRLNGTTIASATGMQTVGGDAVAGFYPNYADSVVLGSGIQNLSIGQPITPQYQLDDFYVAPSYLLKSSYGEFRVTGWKLNKDYSIDIQGRTTVDEMYDLVDGPKPADVPASPIPVESQSGPPATPETWTLEANLSGELKLSVLIPENGDYESGLLSLLVDEDISRSYGGGDDRIGFTRLDGPVVASDTSIQVIDAASAIVGAYGTVGTEIVKILGPGDEGAAPTSVTLEVVRAQLGTAAGDWDDSATVRWLTDRQYGFTVLPGMALGMVGQYLVQRFRSGRCTVVHATLVLANGAGLKTNPVSLTLCDFGLSEPLVAGALPGLRVAHGNQLAVRVPGPLRLGEDTAQPLVIPVDGCVGPLFATVETPPTGQSILFRLKFDDVVWQDALFGPLVDVGGEIPVGETETGVFAVGDFLGNLGNKSLSIEFLQVGDDLGDGTTPGEDFCLNVQL